MNEQGDIKPAKDQPWSAQLEELHEENSRTHFLDVWTREAILSYLDPTLSSPVVVDLGCSSGYLLDDLRTKFIDSQLIGIDFIFAGLAMASRGGSQSALVQGDAVNLGLVDKSSDAVVSANLLEHVRDDAGALQEVFRILKPGALFVGVVPAGPRTYDYYDRYLMHQRRYGYRELLRKGIGAGFEPVEDRYLGTLIFPAFWLVKKIHRLLYRHLDGEALNRRVARDISRTKDSAIGRGSVRYEKWLYRFRIRLPFGVRELVVFRRPVAEASV